MAASLVRRRRNVLAHRRASDRRAAISCRDRSTRRDFVPTTLPAVQLDAIDRHILAELQQDGRLSNVELAQRVHLSPSACLRRVKALEESKVIAQYVALVDPRRVGQPGTSFTILNLERLTPPAIEAFESAVRDRPEILDCF